MEPDRWRRLQELFEAVADLAPDAREAFLDERCADDPDLRREVAALVASDGETRGAIGEAIGGAAQDAATASEPDLLGTRVGPYEVLRELGRGGMGRVFLAVRADDQYRKEVAIKVVRSAVADGEHVRRFRAERQILANLDHPNIARLLDGGETEDGSPYVVMEYVKGEPVDAYCDRLGLGLDARLDLFRDICAAVQYAHQNLVIHRDIKPGNILVTEGGVPKLLDFGIAKLLDAGDLPLTLVETSAAMRLMTPAYASPEQVRGEPVTTATDVYALGVLLYELLTGHPAHAFTAQSPGEVERVVCDTEPTRPSTVVARGPASAAGTEAADIADVTARRGTTSHRLRRELRGDLDNIVLMALRKEPERRYASVQHLAEDVRRYRESLPVTARPSSFRYRASKFLRRNAWAVSAAAVTGAVIAALVVFYTWRLADERDRARREARTAREVKDFVTGLFRVSQQNPAEGQTITARELLDRGARTAEADLEGEPEIQAEMLSVIGDAYASLGLYADAGPLLERALEGRREIFGQGSIEEVVGLNALGMVHWNAGAYDEAENLLQRALDLAREIEHEDPQHVTTAVTHMGKILQQTGRYAEARTYFEEAVKRLRDIPHEDPDQSVSANLNNLAQIAQHEEDYDQAMAYYEEAVALDRERPDAGDSLATSIANLGSLKQHLGDLAGAEPLFGEALELMREWWGPDSPQLFNEYLNLGMLYRELGELGAAEEHLREAVMRMETVLGPVHADVGYALGFLGSVLTQQGRLEEAEAVHRRAVDVNRQSLPPDSPYVAQSLLGLGSILTRRDRTPEAIATLEEARGIAEAALPPGHSFTASIRRGLGIALTKAGRFADAEGELLAAEAVFRETFGPDDRRTRSMLEPLVALYEARGQPEEAERYRARLPSTADPEPDP